MHTHANIPDMLIGIIEKSEFVQILMIQSDKKGSKKNN